MAALDFPASPTTGQIYDPGTGTRYIWNGAQWDIIVADPSTLFASPKNWIVNPVIKNSQQNGLTDSTADGVALADQWFMYYLTGATVRGQRVAARTPRGGAHRLRMTINVADPTITNDYIYFQQPIEGNMFSDALYGLANGIQTVLRFGWKGPAGTYGVSMRNSGFSRSLVLPFTVTAGQANTDIEVELIIPPDVAGTWLIDNGIGITASFVVVAGVTTAPGVWTAGNFAGPTGISNGAATVGNVFELFDVGFYPDPENTGRAPDFVVPEFGDELRKCQRYWEPIGLTILPASDLSNTSWYKATKRTTPTITLITGTAGGATFGTIALSPLEGLRQINASSGLSDGLLTANARM